MDLIEEIIDVENWDRRGLFTGFLDTTTCYTVLVDCTSIYKLARSRSLPFLPVLLHALLDGVNSVSPFRVRVIDGGTVVRYSVIDIVTTEMSTDGKPYPMFVGYRPKVEDFVADYRERQAITRPPREKGDPRAAHINTLRVSVLPGIFFTSVPCHDDPPARRGAMFMNVGARTKDACGRVMVPMGVTFAHSLLMGVDFTRLARYVSYDYARKQQHQD